MKLFNEFIVFSVFSARANQGWNEAAHKTTRNHLKQLGIPFVEAKGVYNGQAELAFVVDRAFANIVKSIAWSAAQECVLTVNSENTAFLTFVDGSVQRIGRWQAVPSEYAGDRTEIKGRKYSVK